MSKTLWAMLISGGVLFVMYLVILAPARWRQDNQIHNKQHTAADQHGP